MLRNVKEEIQKSSRKLNYLRKKVLDRRKKEW